MSIFKTFFKGEFTILSLCCLFAFDYSLSANDKAYRQIETSFENKGLVNLWGAAYNDEGQLWVAINENGFIQKFTPKSDGTYKTTNFRILLPDLGSQHPTGLIRVPCNAFNTAVEMLPPLDGSFIYITVATSEPEEGNPIGTIFAFNENGEVRTLKSFDNSIFTGVSAVKIGSPCGDIWNLLIADFFNNKIIELDQNFNFITDDNFKVFHEDNYSPFNVHTSGGRVYVTYALQNEDKPDEEITGTGLGHVHAFTLTGLEINFAINRGHLNAPWGVAKVPEHFGLGENAIIIGNLGDGQINAYDETSSDFIRTLDDCNGDPINLETLWELVFKPGSQFPHDRPELTATSGGKDEEEGYLFTVKKAKCTHTPCD